MSVEPIGFGGSDGNVDLGRRATDHGVFEPQGAVVISSIAGCTQVEAELFERRVTDIQFVERPHLDLRVVNQGERGLVLVGTATGTCVIGCIEHSVGADEVGAAAGAEPPEVTGTTVSGEVKEPGGGRAEGHQVSAGDGRVAAIVAGAFFVCRDSY